MKRVSPTTIVSWYEWIGDWDVSTKKFPDFKNHVKRIKNLGMSYMIWCAPHLWGFKSDLYKTMTVETFNSMIKPSLDAQNMSVSNVKIEQVKNKLGFEITKISYSATGKGVTVKQVIFVIPSGSYNYAIYVTEAKKVEGLLDTVFESLVAKK